MIATSWQDLIKRDDFRALLKEVVLEVMKEIEVESRNDYAFGHDRISNQEFRPVPVDEIWKGDE